MVLVPFSTRVTRARPRREAAAIGYAGCEATGDRTKPMRMAQAHGRTRSAGPGDAA